MGYDYGLISYKDAQYNAQHSTRLREQVYKSIKKASEAGYGGIVVNVNKYEDILIDKVFKAVSEKGYHVTLSGDHTMRITWFTDKFFNDFSCDAGKNRQLYFVEL